MLNIWNKNNLYKLIVSLINKCVNWQKLNFDLFI